ncbi:uncharacterized protein MONBRDRAFT_7244 [Monosiga brevicollis MX1]|uniref:Ig-like domain-containing protein n=1 Tax=Monosiga brevicollis TaxID=81824 RepID=A9UWD7_MONBE|nr:uncharacterized protein MONBRDRAFT_7244 [Monosiga brevicollis MX1]EDQ90748.1 predicted protein [Monosiga brevicollis MX1]|eukprot:XP_001744799.1 hypothetical protein [Monosiga brevicollis MX1]
MPSHLLLATALVLQVLSATQGSLVARRDDGIASTPADAPASVVNSQIATFTFEDTADFTTTFACSLDGAATAPCTSPFTTADNLGEGFHTFTVATNNGQQVILNWTIDLTAPTLTVAAQPNLVVAPSATSILRLTSTEPVVWLCQLDAGTRAYCNNDATAAGVMQVDVPPLPAGRHQFQIFARDQANNAATPVTLHWSSGALLTPRRCPYLSTISWPQSLPHIACQCADAPCRRLHFDQCLQSIDLWHCSHQLRLWPRLLRRLDRYTHLPTVHCTNNADSTCGNNCQSYYTGGQNQLACETLTLF